MSNNYQISITWSQTQIPTQGKVQLYILKLTKQFWRWPSKDEVRWWDTSRTYRVALDCWFDRINLHSIIQIKYVCLIKQLAHMLSKEASRVMITVTLFVCSRSWICQCSLVINFRWRYPSCWREFKEGRRKKNLRWQSRGKFVWFQQIWTESDSLPLLQILLVFRVSAAGLGICAKVSGQTATKQKCKCGSVFSSVEKITNRLNRVAENCSEKVCVRVHGYAKN